MEFNYYYFIPILLTLLLFLFFKFKKTSYSKVPPSLFCEQCDKQYRTFFKECPVCNGKYLYMEINKE